MTSPNPKFFQNQKRLRRRTRTWKRQGFTPNEFKKWLKRNSTSFYESLTIFFLGTSTRENEDLEVNYDDEMSQEFVEKHREYSQLLDYPPFSTSLKKREAYMEDLQAEDRRIIEATQRGESTKSIQMFSVVETKWSKDLSVARRYQKRFPNTPAEAQRVELEKQGRSNNTYADDGDLPMGIF